MSSETDRSDSERNTNLYKFFTTANVTQLRQSDVARPDHSKSKLNRLSGKYNDRYLDVFNATWVPDDPDAYLETSQLGAVTWTGEEKARFFEALDRKGRFDLSGLADIVETKSPAEIRDYILRIEESRDDRQKFSRNAKSVTQPDIEAAVEIDADLEERLEENADALAAFQDHYNYSEARSRHHEIWLIDSEFANSLSESVDNLGNTEASETDDDTSLLSFFKFETMLELSRTLFMNFGTGSEHEHWSEYAEPDEVPSLTLEAARDFYYIVKSLTMRIIQTAIFLSESRLRSTTIADYAPARVLKDSDIIAAVEVLNIPSNSLGYWCKFLKRSRLKLVIGSHRKGRQQASVSLEQAQLLLASTRGQESHNPLSNVLDSSPPQSSPHSRTADSEELSENLEELSAVEETSDSSVTLPSEGEDVEEPVDAHPAKLAGHIGQRKRRAMIEAAEDDFMESRDHQTSILECQSLRTRLALPNDETDVKLEDLRRPKKLRKLKEDLYDWASMRYIAPWEETETIRDGGVDDIEDAPMDAQ